MTNSHRRARLLIEDVLLPTLVGRYASREAIRLLAAIALHESAGEALFQRGGPAVGLWQFETVGVAGLVDHPAAMRCIRVHDPALAIAVAERPVTVWEHLPYRLGWQAILARALLASDPYPLPTDSDSAWQVYLRTWKPGARDDAARRRFEKAWMDASAAIVAISAL